MVHDHLWYAAGMKKPDGGFLCIGCLEGRLGRGLCCDDFTDAPLNDLTDAYNQILMERGRFSPRLIDRLTTPGPPKSPRREALQLEDQHPAEFVNGLPVVEERPKKSVVPSAPEGRARRPSGAPTKSTAAP
jgi:hypothetical protein